MADSTKLQVLGTSTLNDLRARRQRTTAVVWEAPRTPVEGTLCEICADVLALERIGIHDDLIELGADSVEVIQLASRIRDVFGVELPLRALFETRTIVQVAPKIQAALERGALLPPPIVPIPREGPLPLSFSQERMWFIHQLDPQGVAYNTALCLLLTGPLDVPALRESLNALVHRHEALRTRFPSVDGEPVQAIASPPETIDLPLVELSDLDAAEREARLLELARDDIQRPYDLENGPLFRVTLYRLSSTEHALVIGKHHIISDAWSLGVLVQDLVTLYNGFSEGEKPALPPLAIQPADHAVWERKWMRDARLEAELAHWREKLRGVSVLELATDRPRPPVQTYRGARKAVELGDALYKSLWQLSGMQDVTPSITLLAAFKTLLYRYTAQEDIAVGISIANRGWLAVEGLVSAFVNTLVLRTDFSGDPTFQELLAREREVALDAYAHQEVPFAKLVAELNPERRLNQSPLIQVMYNFINVPIPAMQLRKLEAQVLRLDMGGAQFDLSLLATDLPVQRRLSLEYNTDLFDHATAARMLDHLVRLLQVACKNPKTRLSELIYLSEAEQQELAEWNATGAAYPEKTIHALFEEQAGRTPEATALIFGAQTVSFRELNTRANRLAHTLRARGVQPETCVGICMERTPEMVIALLAVLKAGGAFVPLNPTFPAERLGLMLNETQAPIVLTQSHLRERFQTSNVHFICPDSEWTTLANAATENPVPRTNPDSVGYVIYTSGSTGAPKGVVGTHRGIVNNAAWFGRMYPYDAGDVGCLRTPLNFVDSIRELFVLLLHGIPAVILPDALNQDPRALVNELAERGVTRIALAPSFLRVMLGMSAPLRETLPKLKYWFVGGEALSLGLCRKFLDRMPAHVLVNLYGCSEAAGDSLYFDARELGERNHVPIGRPLANTQILILDAHQQPVPVGVPGELYIGGAGVARGYLNQPSLTQEKFVRAPLRPVKKKTLRPLDVTQEQGDTRLYYRTGDRGCYTPDGNIKYLGRADQQVKVRGIRVEVGEVEAVLRQCPAVSEAAVVVREDASHNNQLVAYVVGKQDGSLQASAVRHFLQARVPHYMVPSALVLLESLPLNASGKVDYLALPPLQAMQRAPESNGAAPQDELERRIRAIWERVLDVQPIGTTDDFFERGGHSLLAVQLMNDIEKDLGSPLPLTTLFQSPTIQGLADALRRRAVSEPWTPLVPIQTQGSKPPFFCVHGLGGGVVDYVRLARLLGPDQPFYGLQAYGMQAGQAPDDEIKAMATRFVGAIRRVQPRGPYHLGGYSYGGTVAFEMAQQLHAQGETTALLAMFDHPAPKSDYTRMRPSPHALKGFFQNLPYWWTDYTGLDTSHKRGRLKRFARGRKHRAANGTPAGYELTDLLDDVSHIPQERQALMQVHLDAVYRYMPQAYAGRVTVFRAARQPLFCSYDPQLGWGSLARGGVNVRPISGFHRNLLQEPYVASLASELKNCLENNH